MKNLYEYNKLPTKHKNSAYTYSAFQLNYDKNKCLGADAQSWTPLKKP